MPDPARTRSAPTPETAERARDNKASGPLWARAVHHFYDPAFDIRSGKAFQGALNDFVALEPGERAFHETHLLYRLVLGLEGIHGVLSRIEKRLGATAGADLSALGHLGPIRAALEEIASGQSDMVQAEAIDGEDEDEDENEDELGEDEDQEEDGDDPDFIYDTVPEDEPEQPRRPRRPPQPEAPSPQPQRASDPEREALVGDLVPATEGPRAEAGDR